CRCDHKLCRRLTGHLNVSRCDHKRPDQWPLSDIQRNHWNCSRRQYSPRFRLHRLFRTWISRQRRHLAVGWKAGLMSYQRIRVVWVDQDPVDKAPFSERELSLHVCQSLSGVADLVRARAIIWKLQAGRRGEFVRWLGNDAADLLNHGVEI